MITTILNTGEKKFIFEFDFSPNSAMIANNLSLTPGETEEEDENDTDVDTEVTTTVGKAPLTYLGLVVYRQDLPNLKFEWSGSLKKNTRIPLQVPTPPIPPLVTETKKPSTGKKPMVPYTEPDENYCKGEFHLYQNKNTGLRYVWFDLQFGENYEGIYEGCMVQFPVNI